LRLPWVFSDEPDLSADFWFAPGAAGKTAVAVELGGRFAGYPLGGERTSAPVVGFRCSFVDPTALDRAAEVLTGKVDLGEVLQEYALPFSAARFSASSDLVYKSELACELTPSDYNVEIVVSDPARGIERRRPLHLIVPEFRENGWQTGDLRFLTGAGYTLAEDGSRKLALDPNPWRQVGGGLKWDLLAAYTDRGPRPGGPLIQTHRIRRLRGDPRPLWSESGPAPEKRADQVWLVRVPEKTVAAWKGGIYVLEVELRCGGRSVRSSRTFEVLP
jgi:hypothetical protein